MEKGIRPQTRAATGIPFGSGAAWALVCVSVLGVVGAVGLWIEAGVTAALLSAAGLILLLYLMLLRIVAREHRREAKNAAASQGTKSSRPPSSDAPPISR